MGGKASKLKPQKYETKSQDVESFLPTNTQRAAKSSGIVINFEPPNRLSPSQRAQSLSNIAIPSGQPIQIQNSSTTGARSGAQSRALHPPSVRPYLKPLPQVPSRASPATVGKPLPALPPRSAPTNETKKPLTSDNNNKKSENRDYVDTRSEAKSLNSDSQIAIIGTNTQVSPVTQTSKSENTGEPQDEGSAGKVIIVTLADVKRFLCNMVGEFIVESRQVHFGIYCDNCKESDFRDYRYKCLVCQNYDLCGRCFELRLSNLDHKSSHPVILIDMPLTPEKNRSLAQMLSKDLDQVNEALSDKEHKGINCDVCGTTPIKGIKFKCDDCLNFDICYDCYKAKRVSKTHLIDHVIVGELQPVNREFDPMKDIKPCENSEEASGAFGTVRKVMYNDEVAALKTIKLESILDLFFKLPSFQKELTGYTELRSYTIIRLLGRAQSKEDNSLYILSEFMDKGTLEKVIESKAEHSHRRKLDWLHSIARGLRRMHKRGFVHKDIKPDNLLLNRFNELKIADLGISLFDKEGKGHFYDSIHPPIFYAPELSEGKFDYKVDIYSFGLVAYELLTYERIKTLPKPIVFTKRAPVFMSLIEACVRSDPTQRPNADVIEERLFLIDKQFWTFLKEREISVKAYAELAIQKRNELFKEFYDSIDEALITYE